ncbi:hypothetical protein F5Y14DRAFT_421354 [Nemania sp. NC0429]|nr:hypothetical protein F5Y14DRAFT_421354 [Nemania sp. NC0429]
MHDVVYVYVYVYAYFVLLIEYKNMICIKYILTYIGGILVIKLYSLCCITLPTNPRDRSSSRLEAPREYDVNDRKPGKQADGHTDRQARQGKADLNLILPLTKTRNNRGLKKPQNLVSQNKFSKFAVNVCFLGYFEPRASSSSSKAV